MLRLTANSTPRQVPRIEGWLFEVGAEFEHHVEDGQVLSRHRDRPAAERGDWIVDRRAHLSVSGQKPSRTLDIANATAVWNSSTGVAIVLWRRRID